MLSEQRAVRKKPRRLLNTASAAKGLAGGLVLVGLLSGSYWLFRKAVKQISVSQQQGLQIEILETAAHLDRGKLKKRLSKYLSLQARGGLSSDAWQTQIRDEFLRTAGLAQFEMLRVGLTRFELRATDLKARMQVMLGGWKLLSSTGVVYQGAGDVEGVPRFSGAFEGLEKPFYNSKTVSFELSVQARKRLLRGLEVLTECERREIFISDLGFAPFRGFSVKLLDQLTEVDLGLGQLPRKLDRLKAILQSWDLKAQIPAKIELDFPDKAYVIEST